MKKKSKVKSEFEKYLKREKYPKDSSNDWTDSLWKNECILLKQGWIAALKWALPIIYHDDLSQKAFYRVNKELEKMEEEQNGRIKK